MLMEQKRRKTELIANDMITISTAMRRYKIATGSTVTRKTVINWCHIYKFGKKVAGRWFVDAQIFNDFLLGELE